MPQTTERWQNKVTNLKDGVRKLYETKDFSDVVFTVGQKRFKAHKLILASRCTEFSKQLFDPNAIPEIIVEDERVTETGFEILLCFIYTDKLGTDDKKSIVQAYLAADYYNQKKLKQKCEEHIESWTISVDEVCPLLNASLVISKLKEKCLNFIKNNALDVISSDNFFKLNYRALVAIMESGALKDVEKKQLVSRVIEWGAHPHTSPVDYALVREDFLSQNPHLLGLLKIEELSPIDFGKLFTVDYPTFLKPEEIVKFMRYHNTSNKADLPEWCPV